jgi:hypothetical protein
MVLRERESSELPAFDKIQIKGTISERFKDHFEEHPLKILDTNFHRNKFALEWFERIVHDLKKTQGSITINEIGLGIEDKLGQYDIKFRPGTMRFKLKEMLEPKRTTYETFELLNILRNAGIKPEQLTLYAMDIRKDPMLAVKSTKTLKVVTAKLLSDMPDHVVKNESANRSTVEENEYFKKFFPDLQGKTTNRKEYPNARVVEVRIPRDYAKSVVCPEPLDITKTPAPVKADITFSYIFSCPEKEERFSNLVKSTKPGGYIITELSEEISPAFLEKIGVERVFSNPGHIMEGCVYRVKPAA